MVEQTLPGAYLVLFPPLLSPVLWERPANVPALVRLLQAYLQRAPGEAREPWEYVLDRDA